MRGLPGFENSRNVEMTCFHDFAITIPDFRRLAFEEAGELLRRAPRYLRVISDQLAGQFEEERIVTACGDERQPERATVELRQRQ